MDNLKIKKIIDELNKLKKLDFVDNTFKLFRDNVINADELNEILKTIGYNLPSEFFKLDDGLQKSYFTHTKHIVTFNDSGYKIDDEEIFNPQYFYCLSELAKTNISFTNKLIEYIGKLDNLPLYYLGMEHIRIKNVKYAKQHQAWMKIIKENKIITLYDFLVYISKISNSKEKTKLMNSFKDFCKDHGLKLDLDLDFCKFAHTIELILAPLKPKIRNTIKVKFLCLKPEWLNEKDYNKNLVTSKTLINKYSDLINKTEVKNALKKYSKNTEILDSFSANGYLAIFYSLVAEVV